jgi:hypothetical protein
MLEKSKVKSFTYCYSRAGSHPPTLCFKTVRATFTAHGYSLLHQDWFSFLGGKRSLTTYPTLTKFGCVLGINRIT